jgi:hypothetical protein
MGSGASVDLVAEQAKPLDLSDVLTPRGESVKAELIRIRTLLHNTQFEPADAEPAAEVGGSVGECGGKMAGGGVNWYVRSDIGCRVVLSG